MVLDEATFAEIVETCYQPLYRFAYSLTGAEADACDLTQETFSQFARKGHQLRDRSKARSWLFTTLYRAFIDSCRWKTRYPHIDVEAAEPDLPVVGSPVADEIDGASALEALARVPEHFRAPLALFYLQDHSYLQIAEILGVPPGTVMSRISRGREYLRKLLADSPSRRPVETAENGQAWLQVGTSEVVPETS